MGILCANLAGMKSDPVCGTVTPPWGILSIFYVSEVFGGQNFEYVWQFLTGWKERHLVEYCTFLSIFYLSSTGSLRRSAQKMMILDVHFACLLFIALFFHTFIPPRMPIESLFFISYICRRQMALVKGYSNFVAKLCVTQIHNFCLMK